MAGSSRLTPLVPPLRFSCVEQGIYRGAYPSLINLRFLRRLRLRSIVSLVSEAPSTDLLDWCRANNVENHSEIVSGSKDEVMPPDKVAELLQAAFFAYPSLGPPR